MYLIAYPIITAIYLAWQPTEGGANPEQPNGITLTMAMASSQTLRYMVCLMLLATDPWGAMEYHEFIGIGAPLLFGVDYTSMLLVTLSCFLVEPMVLALADTPHASQRLNWL